MKPRRTRILFFYTLSPSSRFSISFFGGPQYSDIGPQFALAPLLRYQLHRCGRRRRSAA